MGPLSGKAPAATPLSPSLLGQFQRLLLALGDARHTARAAVAVLQEWWPHLLFVHFADPDAAGHRYGWMSPQQKEAISLVDQALGTLLEAVAKVPSEDCYAVLLTADHGGRAFGHGSAHPEDVTIPWIAWGAGIKGGYQISRPVRLYDTAPTVLHLLGLPVPEGWDGRVVEEALLLAALP